jgi:hypothetical protein
MALGYVQDVARHGYYSQWDSLLQIEDRSAAAALEILSGHSLSTSDLQTWAAWMDRLEVTRPRIERTILVDAALAQLDVITDFKDAALSVNSPSPFVPVTWRDLWSPTLAKSRQVRDIAQESRALADRVRLPSWQRKRLTNGDGVGVSDEVPDDSLFEVDAAGQLYLLLWRVSIAVAWYESERGTFPASLADLVPRYLSKEPISPRTGKSLVYTNGVVSADPGQGAINRVIEEGGYNPDLFRWTIGRSNR